MRLAVAVTAKLDSLSDCFKFASVAAEFAAFPREKVYVVFRATVASLPNVGGSLVVYDGVADAFASRPGNGDDSVRASLLSLPIVITGIVVSPIRRELRHG